MDRAALDLLAGSTTSLSQWSREGAFPPGASPAIGPSGTVCVGTLAGDLVGMDASDGHEIWSRHTGYTGGSPVVGPHGRFYVAAVGGTLSALDPSTGTPIWEKPADPAGHAHFVDALSVAGGGVLVARSQEGHLFGIDADNGERLWEDACAPPVALGPLSTAGGLVIAPQGPGTPSLKAVDARTGEPRWTLSPGGQIRSLAARDGIVYVAWERTEAPGPVARWIPVIRAVREDTGEMVWERDVQNAPGFDQLSLAAGVSTLVASTDHGSILGLDPATGRVTWSWQLGSGMLTLSPPVVGPRGEVYVTEMDRGVHRLDPATGHVEETFATAKASTRYAPAFTAEAIAVTGDGGQLHFVRHHAISVAERIQAAGQAPTGPPPSIEVGQEWVRIDGVRLPRRA